MAPPRVLLVDDNAELLALLAKLLESEGWEPVTAGKGWKALDLLKAKPPQAAVLDILLPDMMGYEVAAALRKAGIPFVFMTGVFKGGRAATDARNQHGAAGYFEKPFEARRLLATLRSLLPAPASQPAEPPRPAAPPTRDFDVEVAVEADEPLDPLELTGKVTVTEAGRVSAVIEGAAIKAARVAPVRPPPIPAPKPAPTPRPAAAEALAPEGALHDNFPELVTAFHLALETGELTLQKGKVKKTVYFERGRPCFAISNLVTDRFGPFLVRAGKITASQLELCRAAADQTGRRTGDVLVEMGLLNEQEKIYYLAQQVKAIIYSIFGWEEGQYRIHFTDRAAREAMKLDLHPANLVVRGVKKLYKPERMRRLLAPGDRFIPSQDPGFQLHEVALEAWEAELLPKVDGTRTVTELAAIAARPEVELYGFLCAMLALKLVEKR